MNIHDAWIKAKSCNGSITRHAWRVNDEVVLCLYHGMDNIIREFYKTTNERGDMSTNPHVFCVADIMADDWQVVHLTGYHNEKRERLSNELIKKNGGWIDGYEYAHCSSDGKIYLTQYKPEFDEDEKVWKPAKGKNGLFIKFKWEYLRAEVNEDYSKTIIQKED